VVFGFTRLASVNEPEFEQRLNGMPGGGPHAARTESSGAVAVEWKTRMNNINELDKENNDQTESLS